MWSLHICVGSTCGGSTCGGSTFAQICKVILQNCYNLQDILQILSNLQGNPCGGSTYVEAPHMWRLHMLRLHIWRLHMWRLHICGAPLLRKIQICATIVAQNATFRNHSCATPQKEAPPPQEEAPPPHHLLRRRHHLRTTSLRGRFHPFMETKVSKMIKNGNQGFQNDPKWKLRFPK